MLDPSSSAEAALPECSAGANRRVSIRYACTRRPWLIRVLAKPSFQSVRAIVQDISTTGLSLALGSKVSQGAILAIEFRSSGAGFSGILSGRVVHARRMEGGSWLIGCQLSRPLSSDDLDSLLQDKLGLHPAD